MGFRMGAMCLVQVKACSELVHSAMFGMVDSATANKYSSQSHDYIILNILVDSRDKLSSDAWHGGEPYEP